MSILKLNDTIIGNIKEMKVEYLDENNNNCKLEYKNEKGCEEYKIMCQNNSPPMSKV